MNLFMTKVLNIDAIVYVEKRGGILWVYSAMIHTQIPVNCFSDIMILIGQNLCELWQSTNQKNSKVSLSKTSKKHQGNLTRECNINSLMTSLLIF